MTWKPSCRSSKRSRLKVEQLESDFNARAGPGWRATGYYRLTMRPRASCSSLGAIVSLPLDLIGAPIAGKSPLELIRVYLTFPLGEKALSSLRDRASMPSVIE